MTERVVFYDATCGFCSWWVQFFLRRDSKGLLRFAPLEGETAHKQLKAWARTHAEIDSIVLLDRGEILYWSKAAFRIFWWLGGLWRAVGWLSWLPQWLLWPCDLVYRIIAHYRHSFSCTIERREEWKDRFLP